MENAAKALEIAGGILLAVIIMALIVYFFSNIGVFPQQEETMESAEQLSKFNLEYEVYEKSAMYGVDVISCLNKAKSNNDKYIEGGGFLSGNKYNDEFTVDVWVKLLDHLEEEIEIYYINKDAITGKEIETLYTDTSTSRHLDVLGIEEINKNTSTSTDYYTEFLSNDKLYSQSKKLNKSMYLTKDGGTHNGYYSIKDNQVIDLLKFASKNPKMEIKNSKKDEYRIWSKAVWKTALYDFKTRFFRCTGIEYSATTGRVNKVTFEEINKK